MSNGNRDPGPIPNRWLNCPRKSENIIADKFLAFKTPLSKAFTNQMPIQCIFTPDMIFDYCKRLHLKLGLWIDLTNTNRFYDRAIVEANKAKYFKLQCRGHAETPSREQTESFIDIVDLYINDNPFGIVGVHCTHGFNRTGFLIVSYLVERFDYSVEDALTVFARARSPGIYKQDYINELYARYRCKEDATPAPELPEWCLEFDDSDPYDRNISGRAQTGMYEEVAHSSNSQKASAANETHSNGSLGLIESLNEHHDGNKDKRSCRDSNGEDKPRKKRRRELNVQNATFMEGVPGVVWVTDQPRLGDLQQKVQDMCGWQKNGFPGAQPVSMDFNNLTRLSEIPYLVSWKADGTRYMMLINRKNEIYFFDRNNSCFQVKNLSFVKSSNLEEHLEDTLLDGEMVLDKFEGQTVPRYLIYDIIRICNKKIGDESFPTRLKCIKKEIIDPRIQAFLRGIIHRPSEPFSIRNKDFWELNKAESLLSEKFAKNLPHEPDGLIFQPSAQPYTAGACTDVLKWKPLHMNSVDFLLKFHTLRGIGIVPEKQCHLFVGGYDMRYAEMPYTSAVKNLENKIIECTVNEKGKWTFMRERTDKTLPNSKKTADAVLSSICNPVTKEILLDYIAKCGFRKDTTTQ